MFGLLYSLGVLAAMIGSGAKNAISDNNAKANAMARGKNYYTDYTGRYRSVENNHRVGVMYSRNGDTVDVDLKTGKILRNYSEEKRREKAIEQEKSEEQRKKNKEMAIKNGRLCYSHNATLFAISNDRVLDFKTQRDEETRLYLYVPKGKKKSDIIEENNYCIKSEYSKLRKGRTETEALEYAKKIGAVL